MIEMAMEETPEQAMESFSEYYVGKSYSLEMGPDCFNIIETTSQMLLGQLRRNEEGLWYNIPLHIYKQYTDIVLNGFDLVNQSEVFEDSLYSSLYMAYEFEDLSRYLFYLSICITDLYEFDIKHTNAHLHEDGQVFIEGEKKEWVIIDDEPVMDRTLYLINIYDNANVVIIEKIFDAEELEPTKNHIKLEELNKSILDELKGKIV